MSDDSSITIDTPFEFTSDGYSTPSLRDFGAVHDLGVAITAMQFESDYLKSCKTYIVGYDQYNVQILKQDCIYGGIRDLLITVDAAKLFYDLSFYLLPIFSNTLELSALVKGFSQDYKNLPILTKGWSLTNPYDLAAYVRSGFGSSIDLGIYVKTFLPSVTELSAMVKGWFRAETSFLLGVIKGFSPDQIELPAYLKSNFSDTLDLTLDIFKIWHPGIVALPASIGGWQEVDLLKYIRAFSYTDLPLTIRATYLYDLAASMSAVLPIDISFSLYGWAASDMAAAISYARSPNDLAATITSVPYVDLLVTLKSFLEVGAIKNLPARIAAYYTADLSIFVSSIPSVDLGATLISRCFSKNLGAVVYPKVVYVRKIISISYLECLDLAASVNPLCFGSSYKDLGVSLYSMYSKNLKATVFGTDGSNIKDLNIFINSYDFYEEATLKIVGFKPPVRYVHLALNIEDSTRYTEISTVKLYAGVDNNYTRVPLGASIVGMPIEVDLGAFVQAYSPMSYEASALKERFITLKLNHSSVEEWRRYVELTFSNYVRSYYYFSGNQKVYQEFVDDQWIVQVKGYSLADLPEGIDRTKINRKYIFNLKRYPSIDAAIKDMTARVMDLKASDLGCIVVGEPKKELDLSVYIASKVVYRSNRLLPVSINPV